MFRRCFLSVLACLTIFSFFGLAVWVIDQSETALWVGAIELNVNFIITDASSGDPIPKARINIFNEGGFYDGADEDREKPFDIRTDADGIGARLLRNNRCTGRQSRLRFTDSRRAYWPVWNLRVFADGYETSEWIHLWDGYPGEVERESSERDRLSVRISLRKN